MIAAAVDDALDPLTLRRLRWRARRGLLENDLLVSRFLDRHGKTLTRRQATAFESLLALDDPTLLDLLLRRMEPGDGLDRADVRDVLELLRTKEPQ